MPNWCENDLTVEGPTEVVEEFLRFAAGESPFDFNCFVPYPAEFQQLDDAAKAWDKEHAEQPDCDRQKRPKDGFNSGGYKWCVANWGTKWPPYRVELEEPVTSDDGKTLKALFHFGTAESPPRPVIENAAKRYPALTFELRYFECGFCCNGRFRCKNGKLQSDKKGPYFCNRGGGAAPAELPEEKRD